MQDDSRMLRIAYVTPYDEQYHSVNIHTARRVAEWNRLGASVEQFVIGDGGRSRRGAISNAIVDFRDRSRLTSAVENFGPSVIYVRWLSPVPGLLMKLNSIAPVVLDIHANDIRETARESKMRQTYMKMYRNAELRVPNGATFVVNELAEAPEYDILAGRRAVFGNGSWVERRASIPDGKPKVGIAVGAPNAWTALDRYATLAQVLQDAAIWVAVCPPDLVHEVQSQVGGTVKVVAAASEQEYYAELASWTVGMASLGLERKGLRTATPLKVRDYVGIGLPTILPFWDEGVSPLADPLVLQLAGEGELPASNIDPNLIRQFIRAAHGKNLSPATCDHISGVSIESRRLKFLNEIAYL
ncbi:glycosyltransferase [Glutamicibacter protophormiae]|uniref:Glycosyltransferase n=1 Tax=Glutamicibacter protophormiae TaxID=37930 RepID=A0ABS4XU99_GLUPR|nr:glycosyltransferase [Glutamicibacter protophormiae]MBP2399313.1 hypothetical protein [Glutamicibacter protophormiae]GGM00679.1 hypothetical protein GCM10010038_33460 [Glutamicibacter protophormiae]